MCAASSRNSVGVVAADLVADDGDEDLAADAPRAHPDRAASQLAHDLAAVVADLVGVPPGSIPITTSGKVRRSACPGTETFGSDWISAVYEAPCAAAWTSPGISLRWIAFSRRIGRANMVSGRHSCNSSASTSLTGSSAVHPEPDLRGLRDRSPAPRALGLAWPADAETMIGMQRLNQSEALC